jgi:hypothetical protein
VKRDRGEKRSEGGGREERKMIEEREERGGPTGGPYHHVTSTSTNHHHVASTSPKPSSKTVQWPNINGFDSLMAKNTRFWSWMTKIELR